VLFRSRRIITPERITPGLGFHVGERAVFGHQDEKMVLEEVPVIDPLGKDGGVGGNPGAKRESGIRSDEMFKKALRDFVPLLAKKDRKLFRGYKGCHVRGIQIR